MTAATTLHPPHSRPARTAPGTTAAPAQTAEALAALASCDSLEESTSLLVNRITPGLTGTTMAVGIVGRDGLCHLQAITGLSRSDGRSERVRAVEAALDETVLLEQLTIYPPTDKAENTGARPKTYAQLARLLGRAWVVGDLLRDLRGRVVGAWLVWGDDLEQAAPTASWLRSQGPYIASVLRTAARADRGILSHALQSAGSYFQTTNRRRWILGGVGTALLLAVLPLKYNVRCHATLEPVTRRFVAAPFDAKLSHTLVEPGDLVAAGQPLAELDGREIRWELAALEADLGQAAKSRDAAMADRKTAAAQLARLEMKELESRIALLHDRQQKLAITSPLAGIVVSGDLARVAGAPLSVGETLFEVAPLDAVIVEVAIPQSEISYVKNADSIAVRLDAFPGRSWTGTVHKIHPRSELRDAESVFIAEVMLSNDEGLLRPGMRGRAKIAGCRAPLGWHLFHKPMEAATRWLIW